MAILINNKYYKITESNIINDETIVTCVINESENARKSEKNKLNNILSFMASAEQYFEIESERIKKEINTLGIVSEEMLANSPVSNDAAKFIIVQQEYENIINYIFGHSKVYPQIENVDIWEKCGFNSTFLIEPINQIGFKQINLGPIGNENSLENLYNYLKNRCTSFENC